MSNLNNQKQTDSDKVKNTQMNDNREVDDSDTIDNDRDNNNRDNNDRRTPFRVPNFNSNRSGGTAPRDVTQPNQQRNGTSPTPGTPGRIDTTPNGTTTPGRNGTTPNGTTTPGRNGTTPNGTTTPGRNGTTPNGTTTPGRNGTTPNGTTPPVNGTSMPDQWNSSMPRRNGTTMPDGTVMPDRRNGTMPNGTVMPDRRNGTMPNGTVMPGQMDDMMPNGTRMPGGMGPNGSMMPNNGPGMPYINFNNQGNFDMPGNMSPNFNPYCPQTGVPLFPLYGYDNSQDLDRDVEYFKRLYPNTVRSILKHIDDECDKLEYDGSMMFDEYPDKTSLERVIDRIYERVSSMEEEPQMQANYIDSRYPRRRQNYLRDIVQILLLNEIFNRRRRYRSRRRWF